MLDTAGARLGSIEIISQEANLGGSVYSEGWRAGVFWAHCYFVLLRAMLLRRVEEAFEVFPTILKGSPVGDLLRFHHSQQRHSCKESNKTDLP